MLDRHGKVDDRRGLEQGVTDTRPVKIRFGLLVEKLEASDELRGLAPEQPSAAARALSDWVLNPPILLPGVDSSSDADGDGESDALAQTHLVRA